MAPKPEIFVQHLSRKTGRSTTEPYLLKPNGVFKVNKKIWPIGYTGTTGGFAFNAEQIKVITGKNYEAPAFLEGVGFKPLLPGERVILVYTPPTYHGRPRQVILTRKS